MGNANSGRKRYNPEERREQVTVAMAPSLYQAINAAVTVGSFSMKVDMALREWMAYKQMLVQYQTPEQKVAGTPVVLNEFATRLYACSEFMTGYAYKDTVYEDTIQAAINEIAPQTYLKKSAAWVRDTLVPAIRRRGLLVQVVDEVESDLFDVWVCSAMLGDAAKHCGRCSVLNEIEEYLRQLRATHKR